MPPSTPSWLVTPRTVWAGLLLDVFPQYVVSMSSIKGMKTSTQLVFRAFDLHNVGETCLHSLGMSVVLLGMYIRWGCGPGWGEGQVGMGTK